MKVLGSNQTKNGIFTVYSDEPNSSLIKVNQTHSTIIESYPNKEKEADGLLIAKKDLTGKSLAIKTADCMPILLESGDYIALIHVGWRGLANGILSNTKIKNIKFKYALIGPSIGPESFQVTEEFLDYFPKSHFFNRTEDIIYYDLWAEATRQLQHNFQNIEIENMKICTYKNTEYNSYRRNKTDKRNWNIFQLKE